MGESPIRKLDLMEEQREQIEKIVRKRMKAFGVDWESTRRADDSLLQQSKQQQFQSIKIRKKSRD